MNFIHNNYKHDWKIGDWAYSLQDIVSFSEDDVNKFAPVLRGEEIMQIKNWRDLRLLRIFPEQGVHGSEVEPANMLGLAFHGTYAIAGWRNKPKPDTSHIEERIEKARQELEAAQRELKEMQS